MFRLCGIFVRMKIPVLCLLLMLISGLDVLAASKKSNCSLSIGRNLKLHQLQSEVKKHTFSFSSRSVFFHQIPTIYAKKLERFKLRYSEIDETVLNDGFLWTYLDKKYFRESGPQQLRLQTFKIKIRAGWKMVNYVDLLISEDLGSEQGQWKGIFWGPGVLYNRWLAIRDTNPGIHFDFNAKIKKSLELEGFPTEAQFYRDLKIAGFWIEKDSPNGRKNEWVFVHPEGILGNLD